MISNKHSLIPKKYKKWLTLIGSCIIYCVCGSIDASGVFAPYLISYLRIHDGQDLKYSDAGWVASSDSIVFSLTIFLSGIFLSYIKPDSRLINSIGSIIFW
jgi:hypothetical protein